MSPVLFEHLLILLPLVVAVLALHALWRAGARYAGADWGSPNVNRLDGINRLFCRRYHRLGNAMLPLPAEGPVLIASNHLSGLDAMLLIAASPRPLRFLIAAEQYHRFALQWLFRAAGCIPVERKGRPEKALRAALRALEAGEAVALFPHGGIRLDSEPHRPLKQGVAYLSHALDCPILPVRIDGILGRGMVVFSVLLRSRARLTPGPLLHCADKRDCLQALARYIETPREEGK